MLDSTVIDTLRNIERLQFADAAVNLVDGINSDPEGIVFIDNEIAPTEDQLLTVTAELFDANNITAANPFGAVTGPIAFFWQVELRPVAEPGVFEDIVIATGVGDQHATGPTFTPGDDEVGLRLRVRAVYQDAAGVLETVFSAPTAAVANVNDAPVITGNLVTDTTPTETQPLTAVTGAITDADGLGTPGFTFQWQMADAQGPGGGGAGFTSIAGATAQTFTPTPLQVNRELRVVITYTDDQGTIETVTSPATAVTGDFVAASDLVQTLLGTEGQDIINGGGGADIIFGFGENDIIDGGTGIDLIDGGAGNDTIAGGDGNDTLNGDAGNDIFNYVIGDDVDAVNGGADSDTLNITGTAGANTLAVTFNGTALTSVAGGTLADVETVTINLLDGADTLNYAASAAAVTVDLGLNTASGFAIAANIENVTGGTGSDTLTGSGLANVLNGGVGNDTLNGGADNDTLNGGADNDLFVASVGDGNDTINGGTQTDTYDSVGDDSWSGHHDDFFNQRGDRTRHALGDRELPRQPG